MNIQSIGKRLEAAASFARKGARLADIGTDHAYLPVFLYSKGISAGGVASDINKAPAKKAEMNLRAYGMSEAFSVLCTDGLCGIEKYAPEDIFILGMGGELIANIISKAEWVKSPKIRLILQPMTHPEILRRYLTENGFCIKDECLVKEERIYQVICAEYDGSTPCPKFSSCELLFGRINIEKGGELLTELLLRMEAVFEERLRGKSIAGADSSEEEKMLESIRRILTEEKI